MYIHITLQDKNWRCSHVYTLYNTCVCAFKGIYSPCTCTSTTNSIHVFTVYQSLHHQMMLPEYI